MSTFTDEDLVTASANFKVSVDLRCIAQELLASRRKLAAIRAEAEVFEYAVECGPAPEIIAILDGATNITEIVPTNLESAYAKVDAIRTLVTKWRASLLRVHDASAPMSTADRYGISARGLGAVEILAILDEMP